MSMSQKISDTIDEYKSQPTQSLINQSIREIEQILNMFKTSGLSPLKNQEIFRKFQENLLVLTKADDQHSNKLLTKGLMIFMGYFVQERLRIARNQFELLKSHKQGNSYYNSKISQIEVQIIDITKQVYDVRKKVASFYELEDLRILIDGIQEIQQQCKQINIIIEDTDVNLRSLIDIYKKTNSNHKGLSRLYDTIGFYSKTTALVWASFDLLFKKQPLKNSKPKAFITFFSFYAYYLSFYHGTKNQRFNHNVKDFRENFKKQEMISQKTNILDDNLNTLLFKKANL